MSAPDFNFASAQTASLAARQLGRGAARCARLGHFLAIHVYPQIGHQASNQNADLLEVVHVDFSNGSFRRPEHGSDGAQKIGNRTQTDTP